MTKKPIIGVTAGLDKNEINVSKDNTDSVIHAGGIPFIIPYTTDEEIIELLSHQLDGLLLTGGGDIDPTFFGEEPQQGLGSLNPERDALEVGLIKRMLEQNKPILGICRGCQILNVAAGGDMYQDLYSQYDQPNQHRQHAPRSHTFHTVSVKEGTLLNRISQSVTFKVNSFHHQAVRNMAQDFIVSATAADGVIEAFESIVHSFVLGLQWHPEACTKNDRISVRIFEAFIEACKKAK